MNDWLDLIDLVWGPLLFVLLGIIMFFTLPTDLGNMAAAFTMLVVLIYYVDLIRIN